MKIRSWRWIPVWAALLACGAPSAVWADQTDPRLPALFEKLLVAPDESSALEIEKSIWAVWRQTDDDDARRLFAQGLAAVNSGDLAHSLDSFMRVTQLAPDFAEGWNMASTLMFLTGDYAGSALLAEKVLSMEPRHFGALSGLSQIYMILQRPRDSLKALEALAAIYPRRPGIQILLERARRIAEGDPA